MYRQEQISSSSHRPMSVSPAGRLVSKSFCPIRFRSYAQDLSAAIFELSREYQMGIKLQGIAAKVAKLQHDAEFEAEKLDAKIEGVAEKLPTVFSGAHKAIDGLAKDVGDVEAVITAVEAVTNGGPPLNPKTDVAPTPLPVVNLVPLAS